MTDRERNSLVEAAQGGDAEAFAALVEAHYGMVHGLAYGKTGPVRRLWTWRRPAASTAAGWIVATSADSPGPEAKE